MIERETITIDCATCIASGTTACSECIVGHVVANESGPIALILPDAPDGWQSDTDRVIELMTLAGLLDDPPAFVSRSEFATPAYCCSGADPRAVADDRRAGRDARSVRDHPRRGHHR